MKSTFAVEFARIIMHIPKCFHELPPMVQSRDYRFFVLNNYMFTYSFVGHAIFVPIFYLLGDRQVFFNNLACVALDLLWLFLNFRGFIRLVFLLWIFEVALHASYCLIAFGRGHGFEYYFLALTAAVVYLRFHAAVRIALVAMLLGALMVLLQHVRYDIPLTSIPFFPEWMILFSNAVACFVGIAYVTNYYLNIAGGIEEKLRYQAVHDNLTGLLNRGAILKRLEEEISRTARMTSPFSVAMIDIDNYKKINDHHGHLVGDEVLVSVARRLRDNLRVYDIVGRYGGDEFIAILPGLDSGKALSVIGRLCRAMSTQPVMVNGISLAVTLSVGVTTVDNASTPTVDAVVSAADKALYLAKQKGRNRFEFMPLA